MTCESNGSGRSGVPARRLFCFPYAGGSASAFAGWRGVVPADTAVRAVEYPGHGSRFRETPLATLDALVRVLAEALAPELDRPFAFFGHSLGAIVAFELARVLRRQRRPQPEHLFISAARAPRLSHRVGELDRRPRVPLHTLPDDDFWRVVVAFNGVPDAAARHPEFRRMALPVLRADFAILEGEACRSDVPLDCPLSAFGGSRDRAVERWSVEGWRQQTTAGFRLHVLEGDHFFLRATQSELLAAMITDWEERNRNSGGGRGWRMPPP